ncbi:8478_t:CDS:2, partial [Acaulospora morrowiae]
ISKEKIQSIRKKKLQDQNSNLSSINKDQTREDTYISNRKSSSIVQAKENEGNNELNNIETTPPPEEDPEELKLGLDEVKIFYLRAMFVFGLTKSLKRLPTGGGCISNRPSNGCVAHYNTKANDIFFNRKRELVKFTNAFSSDPELHVVLGPPSTGKTALVREVTSKGNFKPFFIDCRIGQFDSPMAVHNSISMQFKPFFDERKELLKKILPETETKLFGEKEKEEFITNSFSELLGKIARALPIWNFWNDYNVPPPILIIDEANLLSQLGSSSREGAVLLKSFLNWLVANTKQEKRFHAVLTSSDSFFFNWIVNLLHISHATPYVVGDLSKEEAEEYFEKHVISRYDSKFSVYRSEYNKLERGLYYKGLRYSDKPNPALWKDYDLIKTMKAIVKAENQGYILEVDLIKEIGSEKVDSLVDYNFLHRRSTTQFANDITDPPDENILTAMNQPSVRAMKHLLSNVSPSKK